MRAAWLLLAVLAALLAGVAVLAAAGPAELEPPAGILGVRG